MLGFLRLDMSQKFRNKVNKQKLSQETSAGGAARLTDRSQGNTGKLISSISRITENDGDPRSQVFPGCRITLDSRLPIFPGSQKRCRLRGPYNVNTPHTILWNADITTKQYDSKEYDAQNVNFLRILNLVDPL